MPTTTHYYEVCIMPSPTSNGEYCTVSDTSEDWDDLHELMAAILESGPITVLTGHNYIGRYSTPDQDVQQITGAIHNCPPIVYAYRRPEDATIYYAGIGIYHREH